MVFEPEAFKSANFCVSTVRETDKKTRLRERAFEMTPILASQFTEFNDSLTPLWEKISIVDIFEFLQFEETL